MHRLVGMMVVGLGLVALAGAAHGQDVAVQELTEMHEMETVRGTPFTLPKAFGNLVNVVVDNEVHYLYFEDRAGNLRIVLLGPRSAVSRVRTPLQLLTSEVILVKRDRPLPAP